MSEIMTTTDQGAPVQASPSEVIAAAKAQAEAVMDVVESKRLYQLIRGKKFLQVEAWELIGQFNGTIAKVESVERVEIGDVSGYKATAVLIDREGKEIGRAEALCMGDEPNWRNKPEYQLMSMAQTRAVSKVHRLRYSWIAVLAGYEPTPAEEMDGVELRREPAPAPAPARAETRAEEKTQDRERFNEFLAYEKCIDEFGKELIDSIIDEYCQGAMPQTRAAWVDIWRLAKEIRAQQKEGNHDRQGGAPIYPR